MIAYLEGRILEKSPHRLVLLAGGVGYEVAVNPTTASRLPVENGEASLFIHESAGMYGGGVTLYGFAGKEEMEMFLAFKSLKAVGAKKALELLDKAAKSLPDFRRAVLDSDVKLLKALFGFTQKTADRLIHGLKDKLGDLEMRGCEKFLPSGNGRAAHSTVSQAVEALAALGYKPAECREALDAIKPDMDGSEDVAEIVRKALRRL